MHTTTILFFVISLFISKISLSQDSKQELLSSQNILFKDDIFINIARYLEAPDLGNFAMTNSIHGRNMASNENLGKILRKNNNYSVVTSDDQYYYAQEYLSQSDHLSFSSFNNPHIILKDNIHLFLKLFLVENSKHSSRLESHFLKELCELPT